jgi:futalosine hydrolase
MKILISYSNPSDIQSFLKEIGNAPFVNHFKYKHIIIDFVELGYTNFETAFKMGKALQKDRYHLVLFAGFANSLNDRMKVGEVVNVINDIPFGIGTESESGFQHAYQLGWMDAKKHPHQRGGFINMSNAYFNVFLPFLKTASITTNILGGNTETLALKLKLFPIHIESSNGLGFQYACLHEGMPFYQLRAIEENLLDSTNNKELASDNLNKALQQIIDLV